MPGRWSAPRLVACLCVIAWCAPGQEIHLKTRTISTASPQNPVATITLGSNLRQTVHEIIQFDHPPAVADLDALLTSGAQVTGSLPDNALVISLAGGTFTPPAGVVWMGQFEAQDKISPALTANTALVVSPNTQIPVIVEFHADIDSDHQSAVATSLGETFLSPAGLLPQHAIVQAGASDMAALAARDEVAYIFPADPAMLTGANIYSCAGMLTTSGPIAQYANVTHGWDLDSDNIAHLTYYFGSLTPKAPLLSVESEILRAFAQWSQNVNVTFQPSAVANAARSIYIEFASGAHGDAYPFDGPGGILAHTFYPVPVNAETIAGDMHFDADEPWKIGGDTDVYTVALHEAGHAIGLSHSDNPGDVMYPYYHRGLPLSANDIGAAKQLYAVPAGETGPVTVSTPPATPAPVTPPSGPTNTGTTVQTNPLTITLDAVPATTQAISINVTGTVTGGTGGNAVEWQTNHGYTGTAMPSPSGAWTAANIPLVTGANAVTVTAFDSADETSTRSATITMQQAPAAAPSPLTIAIASPASAVVTVTTPTISVSGSASGGSGVTHVTWQTSNGVTGVASGTGPWVATGIPIPKGNTTVIVRAYDSKGASAWVALVAVRQ